MIAIIGIDPGLTGAVAAVYPHSKTCAVREIPTTPLPGNGLVNRRVQGREFALILLELVPADHAVCVFIEHVQTMGGKDNALQTQGSLMRTLGAIESALDIRRITPTVVQPKAWKAHYGLQRKPKETTSRWKGRSLAIARKLYPGADLPLAGDHNKAEALLIAHYGMVSSQ